MKKLSQSRKSKKYLEDKFEQKAEPLTEKMQKKLEEASEAANHKIARNNSVYQQSNHRSHLYPTEKGPNNDCILATDFSQVDREMEEWMESREKLGNIYMAISEYIWYLQDLLVQENDSYKKFLIEKERKKYLVSSILEESKFELAMNSVPRKDSLEKSSFSLVKKIEKRFKK